MYRKTNIHTYGKYLQYVRKTDRQADRQTGQTEKNENRPTNRQTDSI
jgi:hypothetical protein